MRTKRQLKRAEIARSAIQPLSELGLSNITLTDLGAKMGMSGAHLLYYFESKKEIGLTALRMVKRDLSERVTKAFEGLLDALACIGPTDGSSYGNRPDLPVLSMSHRNTSLTRGGRDGASALSAVVSNRHRRDLVALAGRSFGQADGAGTGSVDQHGAFVSGAVWRDPSACSVSVGWSVESGRAGGDLAGSGGRVVVVGDRGGSGSCCFDGQS